MTKTIYVFLLAALLIIDCCESNTSSPNYMILDSIQYVSEFPQTFSLNNSVEIEMDIIGMKNFCIIDSLMIFSTVDKEGFWTFVSLPDYALQGNFFSQGQGPFEFTYYPSVSSDAVFFIENGEWYAAIRDFDRGKLYQMNIGESLKNKRLDIRVLNDSLPRFLFNFVMIDSATYFCREITYKQDKQLRYVLDNGQRITYPCLEKLNLSAIKEGEDFNILSTAMRYDYNRKLFVEAPIELNYINMYSLDGTFGKTICAGNKLDNIENIQDREKKDRIYTFTDLRLFNKFWGAVFVNEDKMTYQTERKKLPVIMLFDWQGNPLAELKLNHFITMFDIDFRNRNLYALDIYTDMFYKYNISDILEKLP